jgi:Kef-type K+ transport system membrane component KefB
MRSVRAQAPSGAPDEGISRQLFTIGLVSDFRRLRQEGIARLALVYVVCLFGFIVWIGLAVSWIFFHGMTPPQA